MVKKWFMSNPSMKSTFNTSTMKISYSACSNMKKFINGHNKMVLKDTHDHSTQNQVCNCTRMVCPCPGADRMSNCRTKDVVYQATITNNANVAKTYRGSTEQELKNRVSFHRSCMRLESLKNYCELAKEAHKIRNLGQTYNVTWEILEQSKSFKAGDEYCRLCICEMYHILFDDGITALNDVRVMPCLHKRKAMLGEVT